MARNSSKSKRRYDVTGFTLVELVITIAVLAILSGIGALGYSGYITKANEAADQVLIGAVNTAFQSALYDVGYNDGLPEEAIASLRQKQVSAVQVINPTGIDVNDAFFKYFKGNDDKKFNVVEGLLYSPAQGFYASLNGGNKILFPNGSLVNKGTNAEGYTEWEWKNGSETYTIKTKGQDIANFNGSNFGENMTMEELMGEVQEVTDAATILFRKIMGADKTLTKEMQDKLVELGYVPDTDDYDKAAMNALVVQVAKQSSIYSADDIIAYMKKEVDELEAPESSQGDGMLAAVGAPFAAQYAVITAFANSPGGRDVKMKFHDPSLGGYYEGTFGEYYDTYFKNKLNSANASQATGAITKLTEALRDNADYQKYLNEGNGKADMEGYFSALSMIRDNGDEFIRSGVIDKGYGTDNPELTEMLDALFAG